MPTLTTCMEKYLIDLSDYENCHAETDITLYLQKALDSELFLYAARYPGMGNRIVAGCSDHLIEGISGKGFSVASFFHTDRIISIPYQYSLKEGSELTHCRIPDSKKSNTFLNHDFPSESTVEREYFEEIERIQNSLLTTGGKIVASRVLVMEKRVDIAATFMNLCSKYPNAFVFLFKLSENIIWMGASPEVLLIRKGEKGFTMSLAGTRLTGSDGDWDDKNIEEQYIVTRYICETFNSLGLKTEEGKTFTLKAGPVEHICTPITVEFDSTPLSGFKTNDCPTSRLLSQLAPTPALCGLPRPEAIEVISKSERFDRAFYGGYCGVTKSSYDYALFVNLRSMWITSEKCALYAGGGITLKSNPADEWEETNRKLSTIQKNIIEEQ